MRSALGTALARLPSRHEESGSALSPNLAEPLSKLLIPPQDLYQSERFELCTRVPPPLRHPPATGPAKCSSRRHGPPSSTTTTPTAPVVLAGGHARPSLLDMGPGRALPLLHRGRARDLHLNEAEELLGRLSAALAAARSAGNRIAEGLAAELRGRREAIAPAGFTAPERDEIDGSLLSFDLPDFGPVSTSWDPEDGFGYSIDNSLFLDGPGARRIEAALQQVLLAARSSQRRMDDMWARWQAGEDLEAEIQWR